MASVVITQDREDIARAVSRAVRHLPFARLVTGKLVAVR